MSRESKIIQETKINDSTYEVEIKKEKKSSDKDKFNRLVEAVEHFINRNSESQTNNMTATSE